jgi:hypothetical protein
MVSSDKHVALSKLTYSAEAWRDLEAALQRDKIKQDETYPQNEILVNEISPDIFALESHEYHLKQSQKLDVLRKWVDKVLPRSFEKVARRAAGDSEHAAASPIDKIDDDIARGNVDKDSPEEVGKTTDKIARFFAALLGGISLLSPMYVMTFSQSTNHRLIIVSIAVLVFSFILSVCTTASNQEALGAVAAHTAVMVVYVGSASTNGTSN